MPDTENLANPILDRPLAVRVRPDLVIRQQWFRGRKHWVVKDPIALTFFHLTEQEYAVLKFLDGDASMRQVQEQYERQFAPQQIKLHRLQTFIGELHRNGLIVSDRPGQGGTLLLRGNQRRRRSSFARLGNLLTIRFRGINPEPLLNWLYPSCRWLFYRGATLAWGLLVAIALALLTVHFELIRAKLPTAQAFFGPSNAWWLIATLVIVKIIHETGHALACKRFGGSCHELGVQFLLFAPCLYCDVTDAWLFPNKWHRIAVSVMGMYVETWLAAICTILWWSSEPGLLNSLCLNVMFICSIGTIFFNANPLLRYDGYYILSDWIESPNLDARSQTAMNRLFSRWFLGIETKAETTFVDDRGPWLPLYAVASGVYRMVILVAVYLFLCRILTPYHVEFLADAILILSIVAVFAAPLIQLGQLWSNPLVRRQIRPGRIRFSFLLTMLLIAAVCFIPLPFRVRAPIILEPRDAQRAYVTVPGTLLESVQTGDQVAAGQLLARLDSPELRLQAVKLKSERERQRLQIEHLETRRGPDNEKAAAIPAAKELLADLDQRIEHLQQQLDHLRLTAATNGTVMRPPTMPPPPPHSDHLPKWSDNPLTPSNLGSFLPEGTFVCLVGDPGRLEAVAIIEQSDVDFVGEGMQVYLRLDQLPGMTFNGKVRELAKINLDDDTHRFVAAGLLPARLELGTKTKPLVTSYQVRISLDETHPHLLPAAFGECKIVAAPQSLGSGFIDTWHGRFV